MNNTVHFLPFYCLLLAVAAEGTRSQRQRAAGLAIRMPRRGPFRGVGRPEATMDDTVPALASACSLYVCLTLERG